MRYPKINLILLCTSLIFVSVSNANEETNVDSTPKATDGVLQAGGYRNIDNEKLQALIDDDVLVVDIRRQEEWQKTGIIPGSKTITFFDKKGRVNKDFASQFSAIVKKDQRVVLICHAGVRTKKASAAIVKQLGYKNVINVTEGIVGWIDEEREVVKYSESVNSASE